MSLPKLVSLSRWRREAFLALLPPVLFLALAGLMWWGWLPGGGWGFLLAAISVPWAFWDLRPTFRRPAWTRG